MAKVNWKSFAGGVVVGSVLFSSVSLAAPAMIKLVVDGKDIMSEVPPQIINGSTMIPARSLAEALGAKGQWDEKEQTVVIDSKESFHNRIKSSAPIKEADVIRLAEEARNHYWSLSIGYVLNNGTTETEPLQSFTVKELDYRWMGDSLATKEKYIAYLEEVYTPEQASAFWSKQTESGSIIEIDGKLAQPNADGGSLLNWGEAKVKEQPGESKQKTYLFTVPLGDGEFGYEEKEIKLLYVEGKGWRINSDVNAVR